MLFAATPLTQNVDLREVLHLPSDAPMRVVAESLREVVDKCRARFTPLGAPSSELDTIRSDWNAIKDKIVVSGPGDLPFAGFNPTTFGDLDKLARVCSAAKELRILTLSQAEIFQRVVSERLPRFFKSVDDWPEEFRTMSAMARARLRETEHPLGAITEQERAVFVKFCQDVLSGKLHPLSKAPSEEIGDTRLVWRYSNLRKGWEPAFPSGRYTDTTFCDQARRGRESAIEILRSKNQDGSNTRAITILSRVNKSMGTMGGEVTKATCRYLLSLQKQYPPPADPT